MKKLAISFLITLALFVSATLPALAQTQPKTPAIITQRIGIYSPTEFDLDVNEYNAAMRAGDLVRAREIENRVVYHSLMNYDFVYGNFKNALFSGRGKWNVLFDGIEGGIVGAIGVTSVISTKNIFTALLNFTRGERHSIDQNFFKGQTVSAVLMSMDAQRLTLRTEIENSLTLQSPADYPLNRALDDALLYYEAGTFASGVQTLAEQTGNALQSAKSNASAARAMRAQAVQGLQAAPTKRPQ